LASRIALSRVYHTENIDRRIIEVVKSGNFILGPECKAFEQELATYMGRKHCLLSSSWTAAVHLLHLVQDLKPGDEILVPSLTAFPTIEPLIHCGAKPVFCDIDDTYTMDPADAEKRITPRTVGMIPVHLYGRPADIDGLAGICRKHKLWMLEDCAQSLGAGYRGRKAGAFGEFSAVSFYPSKNLTVYGDGGAIFTDDDEVARRFAQLRNHGRSDKYVHELVGYNLRFNEIQAAIGREQLLALDKLNESRRRVARWYRRELADVPGLTLPPDDAAGVMESVYHMFVIRLASNERRESLAKHLRAAGIETGVHYPIPNHQQPAITALSAGNPAFYGQLPKLPRTEDYARRILSLPMHAALSEDDAVEVASQIKACLVRGN
jgi:dTDP-4-amino-4,6-dideoxygalactose transaminase